MADRRLLLVMATALFFALAYNWTIVVGYAPDEIRHMNYVKLLWEEHKLPYIIRAAPYEEYRGAHAFHPPLYYLLLMPMYLLTKGLPGDLTWHFVRLVSALLCVATLPMIYVLGERAAGGDRRIGLLSAALTGLLPIFGMTAGSINNDAAALFFTVAFLYALVVAPPELPDWKRAVILGVILALGGWSKATVLLCGGVAALALPLALRRTDPVKAKQQWKIAGIALALGAILVSPWHIRSFVLYHQWNPMPTPAPWLTTNDPGHPPMSPLLVMAHPLFPKLFATCNWAIFYTLWAQRDWVRQLDVPAFVQPPPLQGFQAAVYYLLLGLCLAALIGHLIRKRGNQEGGPVLWATLASFVAAWLAVLDVALFMHQGWAEGGRYLLPAFCGFAIWLSLGWQKLLAGGFKIGASVIAGSFVLLNCICLHWLVTYSNPHFIPR